MLHIDTYRENEQLIPYINGFLLALETLGIDTNHVQTFYVEAIDRLQTYEESVIEYLQDENYTITIEQITDWKSKIVETIKYFLKSAEFFNKSRGEIVNFDFLIEEYTTLMSELITERTKVFEVFVNCSKGAFYECEHKDYLVDNDKGLFFIHFGTSD